VKTISSVLPWLIVVAMAVIAIGWMLDHGLAAGKWLVGLLLLAHGAVHLLYALPEPDGTDWPFTMSKSWTASRFGLDPGVARGIGWVLIAILVAAFVLSTLATVGFLVPHGWWPATVAVGALASTLLLVVFFDPQLVLGIAINGLLMWIVAATTVADQLAVAGS